MASQADLMAFKSQRVGTAGVAAAPTDGVAGTAPQLTMSPVTRVGIPTTGLALMIKAPSGGSATAGAGGFTVTPWLRDPVSYRWGSMAAFSAAYDELFSSFAFNAGEIYFQITNVGVAGNVDLHFAEL